MRPRITSERGSFTSAQIEALIQTDTSIKIGRGMELLDRGLYVQGNISGDVRECTVTRNNYDTLHAHSTFTLANKLAWGSAIVRPYVTVSNGVITARFNMGAYFTNTPATVEDQSPSMYQVEGYDILKGLGNLAGDSFAINIGDNYLTAVETILLQQNYSQYTIDPTRASSVATQPKAWPIDEQTTWLTIVNDILAIIGYRGIYSDWDGRLVCESYVDPKTASPEWTYDKGQYTSQLVPGTTINHDYFDAPNRWVGIRQSTQDTTGTVVLSEGSGLYTVRNETSGETSIEARGQEITRVIMSDAADQAALITAVQAQVTLDKTVGTTINSNTSINPLHWHFDVVNVQTADLGIIKVQQSNWSMDLITGSMSHEWAVV